MEAILYKTERSQIVEMEIYETGQKILIDAEKQKVNLKKSTLGKSIIITAAEYASYKADMLNLDM